MPLASRDGAGAALSCSWKLGRQKENSPLPTGRGVLLAGNAGSQKAKKRLPAPVDIGSDLPDLEPRGKH